MSGPTMPAERTEQDWLRRVADPKLYLSDQSWHYEALWSFGAYKLRVAIRRNAYDFQSYARVSVWGTELRWNLLAEIPADEMWACAYYVHGGVGEEEGGLVRPSALRQRVVNYHVISYVHSRNEVEAHVDLFENDEEALLALAQEVLS